MTFSEALELLKQGKYIRRGDWVDLYLALEVVYINPDTPIEYDFKHIIRYNKKTYKGTIYNVSITDLLHDEWVEVK